MMRMIMDLESQGFLNTCYMAFSKVPGLAFFTTVSLLLSHEYPKAGIQYNLNIPNFIDIPLCVVI